MSKAATIASLIRVAARTEEEFEATCREVLEEGDADRTAEFFDRLNIPRSVPGEKLSEPLPNLIVDAKVFSFEDEHKISDGIQKFLDRHERKIKWHATHASTEGTTNVILLVRCACAVTDMRLERLQHLLRSKDELTAREWWYAREMMNRSFLTFRNFMSVTAGPWVDSMLQSVGRDELAEQLGNFYEIIDGTTRKLEDHRNRLEDRRQELTVVPEGGHAPVKPPRYFSGDLMGAGPWAQFWNRVMARAHHFRESLG